MRNTKERDLVIVQSGYNYIKKLKVVKCFYFYLYYSSFAASHHFMIVHKDRNLPYICHPIASPVIILCQDGKRCEAFLRLCIVYHDVGTSTLKVIQFPIKSFVMWIANCLACGSGSGDADALSAHFLLTALNSLTGV